MLDCNVYFEERDGVRYLVRIGIDPSRAEVLDRRCDPNDEDGEEFVAVKFPGGRVWSGIGRPASYYSPEITVYRIKPLKPKKDGIYSAEALLEWAVTRKKKV